ncbi:MAG: MBL fold metallo-hydrolase [Clostridia bacterium]
MQYTTIKSGITNNYILHLDKDTNLLIDTGSKHDKKKFYKILEAKGIALSSIKFIFITHIHADHTGLLKELLQKTKATLIYNAKGKQRLEAGKNNTNAYVSGYLVYTLTKLISGFVETFQCFPNVVTDNYINFDKQPLSKWNIELLELGGHTNTDVSLKIGNDLFCGDICMNTILNHKYFPCLCENKFELMKSWEKIINNKDITTLYLGHGKPITTADLAKDYKRWKNKGVLNLNKKEK